MEQPNPSHSPVEEEELRCMKELEEESAARLKKYAEDQKRSDLRNIERMDRMKRTRARIAEAKDQAVLFGFNQPKIERAATAKHMGKDTARHRSKDMALPKSGSFRDS
ncbi:hypothetical protein BASA81_001397 [Batrachochytrium salamandrivorans]|nr:hypothetical protein BASA81_001397 [Batrachochytrium salamandrivorans]